MAALIDWAEMERIFAASFTSGRGRPALALRLVALLYLQHTFEASGEVVVNTWVENLSWQYFCGETYLQAAPRLAAQIGRYAHAKQSTG